MPLFLRIYLPHYIAFSQSVTQLSFSITHSHLFMKSCTGGLRTEQYSYCSLNNAGGCTHLSHPVVDTLPNAAKNIITFLRHKSILLTHVQCVPKLLHLFLQRCFLVGWPPACVCAPWESSATKISLKTVEVT